MYRNDLEDMPRKLKEELIHIIAFDGEISIDNIKSLEQKQNTEHNLDEILRSIPNKLFPDYWIICDSEDSFYIVFETSLTKHQEENFYKHMKKFKSELFSRSQSKQYGIY